MSNMKTKSEMFSKEYLKYTVISMPTVYTHKKIKFRGRIHKEILSLRQKIVSALRFGLS